jgi:hypothetical protein
MPTLPRFTGYVASGMIALASAEGAIGASYGDDLARLRRHVDVIELTDAAGAARVAVVAAYQGRVMTSTAGGLNGVSEGWINHALIASGEIRPHINVFGGEDRFWLGPEGGPYSLFFSPSAPAQTLAHWQTPAFIDTRPWVVSRQSRTEVEFTARERLVNRAGTALDVAVLRTIRLVDAGRALALPGGGLPVGVTAVGFESENHLTHAGSTAWTMSSGLPSIWILGMFNHGPRTTLVIPLAVDRVAADAETGSGVRSDYFGEVPPDRLKVTATAVFFRADGQARGKIGVSGRRATEFAGSWDAERGLLTLVQFTLPRNAATRPYVDSRWIDMPDPYAGDVINAYNDGPPEPGAAPLGPFYELESSSPAAALRPGESITHLHRTFHFAGERAALDGLARRFLTVSLADIEASLR